MTNLTDAEIVTTVSDLRDQVAELTRLNKRFNELADPAKAAWAHLPHVEIAGMVRMLMRNDLDHEAVCVAGRDRIMYLADRLGAAEAESKTLWSNYDECTKELRAAEAQVERLTDALRENMPECCLGIPGCDRAKYENDGRCCRARSALSLPPTAERTAVEAASNQTRLAANSVVIWHALHDHPNRQCSDLEWRQEMDRRIVALRDAIDAGGIPDPLEAARAAVVEAVRRMRPIDRPERLDDALTALETIEAAAKEPKL